MMRKIRVRGTIAFVVILATALFAVPKPGRANPAQKSDIEKYCAMLYSKDDGERETAVEELVKIGKPAVPAVIKALETDEVYLGRVGAAKTLGGIRDTRAIKPLVAALNDDYAFVRQEASLALGKIGGREAVDEVLGSLDNRSDDFLEAAAATLGLLKDKRALPVLEKLAGSPNAAVAGAAKDAINQIK